VRRNGCRKGVCLCFMLCVFVVCFACNRSWLRVLQTLQCIALISSNSHPAKIPTKTLGSVPFLQLNQLLATLRRVQTLSSPALQTLYESGMFLNERQQQPLQTSYTARSTLVIMPSSILHQWEKELSDWAPFLDVFVFQGSDVHIHELATSKLLTCDVALISCSKPYSSTLHAAANSIVFAGTTLQNEYWRTGHNKHLRNAAPCNPSPIFQIYFWRLILDETQYIDNNVKRAQPAAANKMPKSMRFKVAMCVHSAHRWCVSGTPFNTLDDLKTLLIFLRHELGSDAAWNALCSSPKFRDASFWQSVLHLWRNSRNSCSDILLPTTTNLVLVTSLSSVEREVYHTVLTNEHCELHDLQRACLHPSELSAHCMQRLGIDVSHSRPNAARDKQASRAFGLLSMAELMKRLVAQTEEDLEAARLDLCIAVNDLADHASFNLGDCPRACELYSQMFEMSQDTLVSYPHNPTLESM